MDALIFLWIPATILVLVGLLALSAYAEQHILSPRSMILSVVRTRGTTPEVAERLVARETERLLRGQP